MILSAMMFALGTFVTGLVALFFSIALVRRTRRVTEKRILSAVSTRRAEFDAERDELRARHAVELHRLEREVARVLDLATAHRLDADVKDRDLLLSRAELGSAREEIAELRQRLADTRAGFEEIERKHAESSTALRASRHALKLESRRRVALEESLDHALAVADEKRLEASALAAQLASLRLGASHAEADEASLDSSNASTEESAPLPAPKAPGRRPRRGSVVPLPLRSRVRADPAEPAGSAEDVPRLDLEEGDVNSIAAQADADLETPTWRVSAEPAISPDGGKSDAGIRETTAPETVQPARSRAAADEAEAAFGDAVAEVRALKRASKPAAE